MAACTAVSACAVAQYPGEPPHSCADYLAATRQARVSPVQAAVTDDVAVVVGELIPRTPSRWNRRAGEIPLELSVFWTRGSARSFFPFRAGDVRMTRTTESRFG